MDWQHTKQMQQTIYVATSSAGTNSCDVTYGTPVSRSARVAYKTGVIPLGNGLQKKYSIIILTAAAIALSSRVWIPGENQSNVEESHTVIDSQPAIGERGTTDYWVTYL